MGVGWSCSLTGIQEVYCKEKSVLVSGLAIYHVFYQKLKSSNFILAEEYVEEFVCLGFYSGCRRSLGQREVKQMGILAVGVKWGEDTSVKRNTWGMKSEQRTTSLGEVRAFRLTAFSCLLSWTWSCPCTKGEELSSQFKQRLYKEGALWR